jgi:hypothetical protein
MEIIGIPDGFDGLIWPEKSYEPTLQHVSGILPRGGTILGTTTGTRMFGPLPIASLSGPPQPFFADFAVRALNRIEL